METRYFDMDRLSLDESGKVILGDEELEALEKDFFKVSGGGYYSTQNVCINPPPNSLNLTYCSNQSTCEGSRNVGYCS